MARKSLSFVADGKGDGQVQEFPVPDIGDDGLLMEVELCGICGGGDPILFSGTHPHAHYPLVLGHEMVGRVAAIGKTASEKRGLKEGDRFVVEVLIPCGTCEMCRSGNYQLCDKEEQYGVSRPADDGVGIWGGYGNYLYIDPRSITHKLPGDVPAERAVLIAVLANSGRWCNLGQVTIGDVVVIQGPGAQGICSTVVCKTLGAEVILMGVSADKHRLQMGQEMGADHIVMVDEGDPVEKVREITGGHMADVVLENSGALAAVPVGLEVARKRGRYVLSGYSGKRPVELVKDEIALKELTVVGGWGQAGGFKPGIRIIAEGRYPLEEMVTDRFDVHDAKKGIEKVVAGDVMMKAVIVPAEL